MTHVIKPNTFNPARPPIAVLTPRDTSDSVRYAPAFMQLQRPAQSKAGQS